MHRTRRKDEIEKKFTKQANITDRIQANIEEETEKLEKLKENIAEKARESLLDDGITEESSASTTTGVTEKEEEEEEKETITIKINTKNAYNKLSNYSNGVEDPLLSYVRISSH